MRTWKRHIILMMMDISLINFALWFAFLLRFEWSVPESYIPKWSYMVLLMTVTKLICFTLFKLYQSLWRYSSIPEMFQVVKAVSASSVLIFLLNWYLLKLGIPRSIIVLDWVLTNVLIGGFRLGMRVRREWMITFTLRHKERKHVLIVGAGQAGALIIKEMSRNNTDTHQPVAVVDDDRDKIHYRLHGVPVVAETAKIPQIVTKYRIDEIIIAMPSAPKAQLRRVITLAKSTGLPTRILPLISELAMGKVIYKQVREIRIEDLLGRKPVDLRIPEVADYLLGERVLITGAGGSIGSELCRQVVPFKPESILLLGKGENSIYEIHQELTEVYPEQRIVPIIADVRDREKIEQIMNEYRPTVIFHAAAHKHVPLMEIAPDEAVKNNIFGTKNMAELADKHQVKKFVMISTDKAVNPTSIMGATKRVAEMIIQMMAAESQTKFCAVRFGNVLGSRGSVIPLFKKQIAKGGPVTITHPEMVRFFMTIPEAASLVIQAGALGERGEIFILDMGEPVRILDLAQDLIKLSGYEPGKDIEIKYCGIRPGEKLYEEILTAEEGTTATKYERIYVGKPNGLNQSKLMEDLVYLEQCVSAEDKGKIVEKLRQMVPKYKPSQRWLQEIAAGIDEKN